MRGRRPRLEPRKGWNCRAVAVFPDGQVMYDDFQDPHMVDRIVYHMIDCWKRGETY